MPSFGLMHLPEIVGKDYEEVVSKIKQKNLGLNFCTTIPESLNFRVL